MDSLLMFFFVNKPKTIIPFVISITLCIVLLFTGLSMHAFSADWFDFNMFASKSGRLNEIIKTSCTAIIILLAALLLTIEKLFALTAWYGLFLMERYILDGSRKLNGVELDTLKRPVRIIRRCIAYASITLWIPALVFLFTAHFYAYFVILAPSLLIGILSIKISDVFIKNKLFALGLSKNKRLEDFRLNDLYGEFREMLVGA